MADLVLVLAAVLTISSPHFRILPCYRIGDRKATPTLTEQLSAEQSMSCWEKTEPTGINRPCPNSSCYPTPTSLLTTVYPPPTQFQNEALKLPAPHPPLRSPSSPFLFHPRLRTGSSAEGKSTYHSPPFPPLSHHHLNTRNLPSATPSPSGPACPATPLAGA